MRRWVTLFTTLSFVVLAVSGIVAFVRPFSLKVIGLHSLVGFLFIGLIVLHVVNSIDPMKRHLRSPILWVVSVVTVLVSLLLWWQPAPIKSILSLSGNLGPATEKFVMSEDDMVFHYVPADSYKMKLSVRTGKAYRLDSPPQVAIWLENQGAYHIKTLLEPISAEGLPYWAFKREGWEKARAEAEKEAEVDVISEPTPNGSFDPADYILPADPENPMPYKLLIEVDQADDDQPSLIYSVEIDNSDPRAFQVLEIVGYPQKESTAEGKESWDLYYVDEKFTTALDLIDSALLTIDRKN